MILAGEFKHQMNRNCACYLVLSVKIFIKVMNSFSNVEFTKYLLSRYYIQRNINRFLSINIASLILMKAVYL